MKMPHPGDLRHMIVIGNTVNEINDNGYPEDTDTVVCRVWAGMEDASGRWLESADAENAQRGIRFIIRWHSGITPGMWVEYEGKRHTITDIGEYDFKHRYMQLITERIEGVV